MNGFLMAVDYDLVIIGSSFEAIYAASTAAYLKARVALVKQPFPGYLGGLERVYQQALSQAGYWYQKLGIVAATEPQNYIQAQKLNRLPFLPPSLPLISATKEQLKNVEAWGKEVVSIISEQNSFAVLAALGVDVIDTQGEFCRLPHLAFVVKQRKLRSRSYLIATGSHTEVTIAGLAKIGYLTINSICQRENLSSLPDNLVILGGKTSALELAQTLTRLGKKITLIISENQILPQEDPEIARLIQAQLEAEGIKIFLGSPVLQVKLLDGQKWLQVGNKAIAADEIIIAELEQPNTANLNLEGVGVKFDQQGIQVNQKLQTTNPRIYACGDVIGGYKLSHIAEYEAKIALKNALFLPIFKIDYQYLPWLIFTDPNLARVGMTEAQAKKRYDNKIYILTEYFQNLKQAQILNETTGICKLIVHQSGIILGASIIGTNAGELISIIALAVQNQIKINGLAKISYPDFTLAEIINKIVAQWRQKSLQNNKILISFLDTIFHWWRSYSN